MEPLLALLSAAVLGIGAHYCAGQDETSNRNGKTVLQLSKDTLLPVSMLVLVATLVWTLATDRQQLLSDVDNLKAEIAGCHKRLDAQAQKLSDYRAQVDTYRTNDFDQAQDLQELKLQLRILKGE